MKLFPRGVLFQGPSLLPKLNSIPRWSKRRVYKGNVFKQSRMDPHFLLFLLIPLAALVFRNSSFVFLFVATSVVAVFVASLGLAGLHEQRPLSVATIVLTVLLEAALSRPPFYPYIAVQTLLSLLSTFLPSIFPPLLAPSLALPFPVLLILLFSHQAFSRPSHTTQLQFFPLPLPFTLVIASQVCALLASLFLLLRETHPHDIRAHVYLPLQSLFLVLCAAFTMSAIALSPCRHDQSLSSPQSHVSATATTTSPSYHYRKPSQRHYTLRRSLPSAELDVDAGVPLTTLPLRIQPSQTRIPRLQRQISQRPRPPTPPPLPPSPPKQRQQNQQIRDLLFYSPSQRSSPSKNRKYPRYPPLPSAEGVTSYSSTTGLLGEDKNGSRNDVGVGGSGIDGLQLPATVTTPPKLENRIPTTNENDEGDVDYSRSIYPLTSEGCGGSNSSEDTISPVSPVSPTSPTITISPTSPTIDSPIHKVYTGVTPTKPKPVYERKFTHKLTRSKSDIYPRAQYGYWLRGDGDTTSPTSPISPTSPTSPISPLSPTMPITPNTPHFQAPSTYSPTSLGFEFADSQTKLGLGFEFGETGLGLGDSFNRSIRVGLVGVGAKRAVSEGGHGNERGRGGGDQEAYAVRLDHADLGALGVLGDLERLSRSNHDKNNMAEEEGVNRGKGGINDSGTKKGVSRYKHRSSPAIHIRAPEPTPPNGTSNSTVTSAASVEASNTSATASSADDNDTATTPNTNISSLRRWSMNALSAFRPSLRGSGSGGRGSARRWKVGFGYNGGGGAKVSSRASTSTSTSRGSRARVEEGREGRIRRELEDQAREASGAEWGYGILGDDGFGGGRVDAPPTSKRQLNASPRQLSTSPTHLTLGRQATLPIRSQTSSKLSPIAPGSHNHQSRTEPRRRTPTPNQSVDVSEDFTSLRDPFAPGPVRLRASTFGVGVGAGTFENGNAFGLGGTGGPSKSAPPSPRSIKSNGSGSAGGSPGASRVARGSRRRGGGVGLGAERRARERMVSGAHVGCAVHRFGGPGASSSTLNVATNPTNASGGTGRSLRIWGWGVVPIPQATQSGRACTCPSSPLAPNARTIRDVNGGIGANGDEDAVSREEREDAVLADLLWRRLTRDEGL
ncbi:hypothetical protein BDN71DRAFT_480521 [Pleurotus eryngii]|uniref:Uncharacterized protein n=1 Tax=Pleurotus eryngii TaxID=5323 RepID=A0A9P6A9J6_PLEER|nr:hypothetical protein BDN71DRAFT_480521 [Pleurotus eryngii]